MDTPSTTATWLNEQATPLAIVFLVLALLLLILNLSARNRRIRMNKVRAGYNEDTFVSSLLAYGFDPMLARTAYQYLQEQQRISFPIKPEDFLDEDLGLDSDDLDQTVIALLRLCGRIYQPGLRDAPLVTVEDLVRFVQASPRSSQIAA